MFSPKISTTYKRLYDITRDFEALGDIHPALMFLINSKIKRFYKKNLAAIACMEEKQKELAAKHFAVDVNGNPKIYRNFQGDPKGFVHKNINDRSGYDRELIQFLATPVTIYE